MATLEEEFSLCYHMSQPWSSVSEMLVSERKWFYERLFEQKQREADNAQKEMNARRGKRH